jgi:hypothetical protein
MQHSNIDLRNRIKLMVHLAEDASKKSRRAQDECKLSQSPQNALGESARQR